MYALNNSRVDFAVVLPVYAGDTSALFRRAFRSIIKNTVSPTEIVIAVDGKLSTDLENAVSEAGDYPTARLVVQPDNIGLAENLNTAIATVEASVIVRADSDDLNLDDRFSRLIGKIEEGWDLVGSCVREVDEDGIELGKRLVPLEHEQIVQKMKYRNAFNHMSVAFKTDLFRMAGGYPAIPFREDYGLWSRMLKEGAKAANLDSCLVMATAGDAMLNRRAGFKYALGEIPLQRELIRNRINESVLLAFFVGAARALAFTTPYRFRRLIYRVFLRR